MNRINRITYILLTFLFLAAAFFIFQWYPQDPIQKTAAQTIHKKKEKISNPVLQELLTQYDKEIRRLMQDAHTPGASIAIVKDSTIVYLKALGVKTIGKPDKVDVHSVFRIASVSKCFASTLTGILEQDKMLSWDDKVIQYLPDFSLKSPEQTAKLTLRHVLSHTTGLPYHTFTNMVEEGKDLPTLLSKLNEVPLNGAVGEIYSYQNVAYSLIGEVMRCATGKSYEELMTERIFKPLKMLDASISYDAIMQNTNIAKPHQMTRSGWKQAAITNTYYNVAPAGGVNASISDMANWMVALLGDRNDVIADSTLDVIFTPCVKARSKNRNYGRLHRLSDSYYAMGWRVLYYPDDTLIYHGGFVNGYRSEVAINRKDNIAICILANAPGDLADNGIPLFFNLFLEKRDSIRAWYKKPDHKVHAVASK